MLRVWLLIPAVLAACVLVACGGSDDPAPTASPSPTIDFPAVARRVVPDAVLTIEDMPGFEAQDTANLAEQADLSAECDIFDPDLVFPDAVATAQSDPFVGPGDRQVFNHAAIYESTADASAGMASTQAILDRCEDEFNDVVEQVAKDELDRLGIDVGLFTNIDITIGNYDPPPAGDELLGYRMNVSVNLVLTKQEYNLDVIVVREGRVVGAVMFGTFGAINSNDEALLLERVTGKLSAAEEALPE